MKEERFLTPKDFEEDIPASMKDLFHQDDMDTSLEDFDLSELDALLGPEFAEFSSEEEISDTPATEQEAFSEDFSIADFSMDSLLAETDAPSAEAPDAPSAAKSEPGNEFKPREKKTNSPKKETGFSRPKRTAFITKDRKTIVLVSCGAVIGVLLLCILGTLIGRAMDPYDNRILPNTTLGGIDVGGMTRMEAYKAVKTATEDTFSLQNMEVTLPDGTIILSPENTNVKLSVWSAVNAAYSHGRKGTEEQKQTALALSQGTGCNVDMLPFLKLDQDFIRAQLEAYAAEHNVPHTELSYHLEGQQPALDEDQYSESAPVQNLVLTMGTPLEELPVDAVLTSILDAYRFNRFQVTIDSIEYKSTPEAPDVQALYEEFYIAPVNTTLDMQTYEQVPGSYGYALDTKSARQLIADAQYGETIRIPMTYVEPEILGDQAYFRDELGYCETPHTNNEDRNTNLRLACAALDGLILQPGEEFSYNNTLGERTKEKGYKPAAAYSGTNTVNSIGGGVCQGSSTLYYATLLADLEVVERVNHGFRSTYIDIGLDATVNWGGPDYRFKNSSHFPIMIKAEVSDGFVKMWIYGTDEKDYYVKLESEVTGYTEAGKTYRKVGPDSGYRDGQLISGGTDGWYARSYSCKYDKETDELISRDPITFSSYMMVNAVYASVVG